MPKMTLESIQKQIEKLQAQAKKMEGVQNAKKTKSVAQVRALMHKFGVSIEDLSAEAQKPIPAPVRRNKKPAETVVKAKQAPVVSRKPVPAKYRDPNSSETWTGRGKAPRWLSALVDAGHSKDEFLITPQQAPHADHDQANASHDHPAADASHAAHASEPSPDAHVPAAHAQHADAYTAGHSASVPHGTATAPHHMP